MSAATDDERSTAETVRRSLDYAVLGGLVLLGFVAAVQFYLAADRTIDVWVASEFQPPFRMAFNLVLLLVVGVGVSRQIRRLTAADDDSAGGLAADATADGGRDDATTGDTTVDAAADENENEDDDESEEAEAE
jgi:hypothetical protein